MRKLLLLIGIMALVSCQAEPIEQDLAINEPIEGEVIDQPIDEEAQEPEEETPEEPESTVTIWTDGEINIVLSPDLIKLEYDAPLAELAENFYDMTGIEVLFFEEGTQPENYSYAQYAWFISSGVGMKGGRQYSSFNDDAILNRTDMVYITFAQMAGVENPEGNTEFSEEIIEELKDLYSVD